MNTKDLEKFSQEILKDVLIPSLKGTQGSSHNVQQLTKLLEEAEKTKPGFGHSFLINMINTIQKYVILISSVTPM